MLHLEFADDGPCWWGESEQHPTFTAAAGLLAEVKELCREAGELYGWGDPVFVLDDDAKVGVSSWQP